MTDEFALVPDAADGETVDPDLALIVAFLACELTDVQAQDVEQRLIADRPFFEKVAPVIRGWSVTTEWDRSLDALGPAAAPAISTGRRIAIVRIAATIAIIVLPIVTAAQVVIYMANHPGMLGHTLAQGLLSPGRRLTPPTPSAPLPTAQTPVLLRRPDSAPVAISDAKPPAALSAARAARTSHSARNNRPPNAATDTVRVRADGPPLWGPGVRLERMLSVGTLNGPPEQAFGSVGYVASTASGAFFVYDSKDTVIRRFDAAGKYLATMGRGGAGPGEFRMLEGMDVVGDSLLVTYDPRNARISVFGRDGRFRNSFNASLAGGTHYAANVFLVTPDGRVAIRAGAPGPLTEPRVYQWVWFRLDGKRTDSSLVTDGVQIKAQFFIGSRASFGEGTITYQSPTGDAITAWNAPYRFAVTRGTRTTLIERSYTPVALDPEERREWMSERDKALEAIKLQNQQQPQRPMPVRDFEIPERKPALRDIRADRFGRIWVEVYAPAHKLAPSATPRTFSWAEPSVYDVFEPDGHYLGRVELPDRARIASIQRDRIWVTTSGPDGEPVVAVYRIVGAR